MGELVELLAFALAGFCLRLALEFVAKRLEPALEAEFLPLPLAGGYQVFETARTANRGLSADGAAAIPLHP